MILWSCFTREAAAHAALLAATLITGKLDASLSDLRQIPTDTEISTLTIEGRYEKLQRLRKLDAESFYYWYLASKM